MLPLHQTYRRSVSGFSSTAYVNHGSASILDDLPRATTAFWAYPTNADVENALWHKGSFHEFSFRGTLAGDPFEIYTETSSRNANVRADAANFRAYGLNKWLFVVGQWDVDVSANCRLLIGDESQPPTQPSSYTTQAAAATGTSQASADFWVGRNAFSARTWNGRIASIHHFSRVLTPQEIIRLWEDDTFPLDGSCVISSYYGVDGLTPTFLDYSGKGNVGTMNGTLTEDAPKLTIDRPLSAFRSLLFRVKAAAAAGGTILPQMLQHHAYG